MYKQPAVNYLTIEELNVIYALMDTLEQTVLRFCASGPSG